MEELTDDIVDRAAKASFLVENGVPHSIAVVQHFLERGGLLQLEVTWRKHFLNTMIDMEQYKLATEGVVMPEVGEEQFDMEAYRNTIQAQLRVNPRGSREHSQGVESGVGGVMRGSYWGRLLWLERK